MPRIVALAEACIDVRLGAKVGSPGGNAANVAVWAQRGGVDAAFLGAVGSDAAGARLLAALDAEGVDVSGAERLPGSTAWTVIGAEGHGLDRFPAYDPGVMWRYFCDVAGNARLLDATFVHLPLYEEWRSLADRLVAHQLPLSLDIGGEGEATLSPEFAQAAQVVFVSVAGPLAAAKAAVADLLAQGCRVAVASAGEYGAAAGDHSAIFESPAERVDVVDTLGAGDALAGAVLAALASGCKLCEALAQGIRAGARACRVQGAFGQTFPLPDDLARQIADRTGHITKETSK
jgi:fructoselysine 6-kinase